MSSVTHARPPRARWRHRLSAVACSVALSVTGLVVLAAPAAQAATGGVTTAYIANEFSSTVSAVDTSTGATTATIPVSGYPAALAVNAAGTTVYAADQISNLVSVIDTGSDTVTGTIPVGNGPSAIALNPAGTTAYVTNEISHSVSVIDLGTDTVTATIPVSGYLFALTLNPAGTTAYVASFNPNALTVIDTATDTVTATVPLGGPAYAVAVNPADTTVYVATAQANTITTVDAATDTITGTIADSDVTALAFTPDGSRLYAVSPQGSDVTVIDPATNTVIATVPTGSDSQQVAVNSTGTTAYVTAIVSPSGSVPGNVSAIDVATNTVTTVTNTLIDPDAIALHTTPAPVVTAISPAIGSVDGGTTVTITGTGLTGATEVDFGPGNPGTNLACTDDTSCTVTTPAEAAGTVDVQVITPGGTSATSSADQYTFAPDAVATVTGPTTPVTVGVPYTYTVTVTNNFLDFGYTANAGFHLTGAAATITGATDSLGDGVSIYDNQDAYISLGGGNGVPEGSSVTITVTVDPTAPGTVTFTTDVGVFIFLEASATTTTTILGPDLTAAITGPTDPVSAGTPYTYTETITNQADATGNATNVTAAPTLNPAAGDTAASTITAATASQGSCTLTNTTSAACALGTLAPGASATVTVTVLPTTPGTVSIGDNPSADGVGVFANPTDSTTIQVAAPVVTGISPSAGPLTGGTVVTITGTGLAGATAVTFGADGPATAVSCTATACTVTAPAGTAGTVDVQVTTAGGTSATSSGDQYTYTVAPVVTGISPSAGPLTGGTVVMITGTGLAAASPSVPGTRPQPSRAQRPPAPPRPRPELPGQWISRSAPRAVRVRPARLTSTRTSPPRP